MTTTPIKPHTWFRTIRPDEVAECWEGVFDAGLYAPLWDCVESYEAPSPEDSEEPCVGMDCVADFWDRFTPAQQLDLNRLAVLNDWTDCGWSDQAEREDEARQLGLTAF